ncbi:MAG: hypothetical protein AB7F89_00395 [Pirellulaceae bacterium]
MVDVRILVPPTAMPAWGWLVAVAVSGLINEVAVQRGLGQPSAPQTAAKVPSQNEQPGAPGSLRAGVARRNVTPPLYVPYLTSSGKGTHAPFQAVHDHLVARALVLDDGRRSLALVTVDSIGYDNAILGPGRNFTGELRQRISAQTGLSPDAIMLAATHTHQAPETIGLTPFRSVPGVPEWLETHLQDLVAVVVEAWQNRVPVQVFAGSVPVAGIGRNRRIVLKDGTSSRHGPVPTPEQVGKPFFVDEDLAVICFAKEGGVPHAVLLNYTAHPVVTMLLPSVSADYCGELCRYVEDRLPGATCLFTQGADGNINSQMVSTSFDDAHLLGERLGTAAVAETQRQLARQESQHATDVQWQREEVVLEPRDCPPLAEIERTADEKPTASNLQLLRLARKLAEGPIRGEVQLMGVGDVRWVSLPGEPFVETGLALKKAGARFIVGYANGYVGYLPIRSAYADGGYETGPGVWSRVAPGSAERLEAVGRKLLSATRAGSP